ncbi:hypothetical protein BGZ59_002597, partial [Podila verticillata]
MPTRGRRPSALPSRKPSTDQFDALMEDLMQEINILPAGTNSVRNSTRSVSSSVSRSRSRPNIPDSRERDRSHRTTTEQESRVDRMRTRDRETRDRERASTRSSTRSRSVNGRGIVAHCEGCKHDIQSHETLDAVKMAHGDYHRECFKCGRCRRPIESAIEAREYEGRLLCERDYTRVKEREAQKVTPPSPSSTSTSTPKASSPTFSRRPVCAGCEGSIHSSETAVYALGKSWHAHHLSCDHCHQLIQTHEGHVEKNGRVYCPRDYNDLFLPKCRGCGLALEKEAVCAQDGKLEGKWHSGCFGCQSCKKPFPDKSFYVFENAPYCRRHYHRMNNSLCKGCDQPIEGSCAQTME